MLKPDRVVPILILPLMFAAAAKSADADGLKAAVFDIEPVNMPQAEDLKPRLKTYSDLLRKLLAEKGVTVVDLAPQAKKIADNLPLNECNGCDQDIAKAIGADIEVTTAVQPTTATVFNLSGNIKDVRTNRVLRRGVVDVHGQGDDVWSHGVKFLVKEKLTDPPLPTDAAGLGKEVDALPKAE